MHFHKVLLCPFKVLGSTGTKDNARLIQECDIVFLCVKPYLIGNVLEDVHHVVSNKKILVSVAAGVPIEFMEEVCIKISNAILHKETKKTNMWLTLGGINKQFFLQLKKWAIRGQVQLKYITNFSSVLTIKIISFSLKIV